MVLQSSAAYGHGYNVSSANVSTLQSSMLRIWVKLFSRQRLRHVVMHARHRTSYLLKQHFVYKEHFHTLHEAIGFRHLSIQTLSTATHLAAILRL